MLRSIAAGAFYVPYDRKIEKHKKKRKRYSILVIRLSKTGGLVNSRPCENCIQIMKTLGIEKIYYSDGEGNIIVEKVKYMSPGYVSSGRKFLDRTHQIV